MVADGMHGQFAQAHAFAASCAATAAALAAVKPILPFRRLVITYSKLYQGHHRNALDYKELVAQVKKKQRITQDIRREHDRLGPTVVALLRQF